jgi:hypothetical protein
VTHSDRRLCAVYAVLALAALVATWSQNLAFMARPDSGGVGGFIAAAFVNPAAASIGYDILFFSLAAFVWMVVEARRLGIRFVWLYIALSFVIAVSVMFPLFLIARQRCLAAEHG